MPSCERDRDTRPVHSGLTSVPPAAGYGALSEDPDAELIGSISPDWVEVVRKQGISFALDELMKRPVARDDFYTIGSSTAGVKLMRDSLDTQLQQRWDADAQWRLAASGL